MGSRFLVGLAWAMLRLGHLRFQDQEHLVVHDENRRGITIHMYKFVVCVPIRPHHNKPNGILKKLNEHQLATKDTKHKTHQLHPAAAQYTCISLSCLDRLVQITTNQMTFSRNQIEIKRKHKDNERQHIQFTPRHHNTHL